MLQTDMTERTNKRIPITNAKVEDLRQLVKYIYTAKVSPEYTRFQELFVLGDMYNVQSLVDFCTTKLEASLTVGNALDMGIFAETYNSNLLMEKCARFISKKRNLSIDRDWMKKTEKSPKLATKIIKELMDSSGDCLPIYIQLANYQNSSTGGVPCVCAICFKVDTKVSLLGIGIFGVEGNCTKNVTTKVFRGDSCILKDKKLVVSNGSYKSHDQITLSSPILIEANQLYHVTIFFEFHGGATGYAYGKRISDVIKSSGPDPITVTFSDSSLHLGSCWHVNRSNELFHSMFFTKYIN